jgi:hypothetical protein
VKIFVPASFLPIESSSDLAHAPMTGLKLGLLHGLGMQNQNELSSGLSRIRRRAEWPKSVVDEQARERKYPHRVTITTKKEMYTLNYRKSRRRRMNWGKGCVRTRDLFCWLNFKNLRVGALHFVEFEPDRLINNREFFFTMDADYHADMHLAEVLCDVWSDVVNDVLGYGPVLEFRLAWMSPQHAAAAVWAKAAEALIKADFDDHSILVMKAFPLEYEARLEGPENSAADGDFPRRRAAMIRYYRRLFGVEPFPGEWGAEGWLWRASPRIAELIPAPVVGQ